MTEQAGLGVVKGKKFPVHRELVARCDAFRRRFKACSAKRACVATSVRGLIVLWTRMSASGICRTGIS